MAGWRGRQGGEWKMGWDRAKRLRVEEEVQCDGGGDGVPLPSSLDSYSLAGAPGRDGSSCCRGASSREVVAGGWLCPRGLPPPG